MYSKVYWLRKYIHIHRGFPDGSVVKNPLTNAGDAGSIPRSGRSSGEGNGNLLQYSAWKISRKGAWWATVYRVTKELDMN